MWNKIVLGMLLVLVGLIAVIGYDFMKPPGVLKKECEVEKYAACVPVCVVKDIGDCREKSTDGLSKNPVVDFALCMRNRCHELCTLMAWSNCYLPEADRMQWKD